MILPVLPYGHPMLRQKGARIDTVTLTVKKLVADMLETMYASKGIGLAAQQVGQPLQLTVLDVRGVTDRPSMIECQGIPAELADFMPMTLINPVVKSVGDPVTGPEGCLSFPEIFADISRKETVDVTALNEKGQRIQFRCGGLLARAIQHETDHLHGILFIDRMTREKKAEVQAELDKLQAETKAALKKK